MDFFDLLDNFGPFSYLRLRVRVISLRSLKKAQNWVLGCEACDEIAADEKEVLSASTIFIIHIERAQLQIQSDRDVYHCANHVQKHR